MKRITELAILILQDIKAMSAIQRGYAFAGGGAGVLGGAVTGSKVAAGAAAVGVADAGVAGVAGAAGAAGAGGSLGTIVTFAGVGGIAGLLAGLAVGTLVQAHISESERKKKFEKKIEEMLRNSGDMIAELQENNDLNARKLDRLVKSFKRGFISEEKFLQVSEQLALSYCGLSEQEVYELLPSQF